MTKLKYWILGIITAAALTGITVYAASWALPPAIQRGDLIVATSTTQAVRLPIGTAGKILQSNGTVPIWVATSTLGFSSSGGSGATTTISVSGVTNNGPTFIFTTGTPPTGLDLLITSNAGTITFANALQSGYNIPLTASTTNWNNFYNTPSTRISAGTNLVWSGNTLNGNMASSTIIAGGTATHSPSITFSTTSDTNLLLTISCAVSTCTFNPTWAGVLAASRGGTGTNTLASLTVGTNLSISGGQNVLVGTGTQISLGANVVTTLATGTTGTIFNGSIGSNTLTLNLPFASIVNTGQLQAADFLNFNNKLSGSLTSGQVVFASGASTTQSSSLFTFSTGLGLTVNATSTLATTTITQLSLGNGLVSTILAVDTTGKVIATTTSAGGVSSVSGAGSVISSGGATPTIQLQNLTSSDILFGQGNSTFATSSNLTFDGQNLTITGSSTISTRLGIGTTTPQQSLVIQGLELALTSAAGTTRQIDLQSSGGNRFALRLNNTAESGSQVGSDFNIVRYNDAASALDTPFAIKRSNGFTGIGSSTPVAAQLVVQNSAGAANNVLVVASSTGAAFLTVKTNGSTTLSTLGTGLVRAISGELNTGLASLTADVSGVLPIANGGTATTASPTLTGQLLGAGGSNSWGVLNLIAGSNVTITTSTPGQIVIASSGGVGGSGNSAWTIGNGLIYNATSTDLVLIGTSTPTTATLFVQGKGGTNPFTIASSTGDNLITVDQSGNLLFAPTTAGGHFYVIQTQNQTNANTNADSLTFTAGDGSTGTSTGGTVNFTTGRGGTVAGNGGLLELQSGSARANSYNAGTIQIFSGAGKGSGSGGLVQILGGPANGTNGSGGSIQIKPGKGTGNPGNRAGTLSLLGGQTDQLDGVNGAINIIGGFSITTSGAASNGGNVLIEAGPGVDDGNSDAVNGGNTILQNAYGSNGGTSGQILLNDSSSSTIISILNNHTIGINSTTPNAILVIEGTSTLPTSPILIIASSTNASLFQVTANGNVNIATLTASSLVLTDANKNLKSYGGASNCSSGQAVIGITAAGASTCSANGLQAALTNPDTGTGTIGFDAIWNASTGLTTGKLMDNGSVVGINATSSTVMMTLQGTAGANDLLNVASSTSQSFLMVKSSGNVGVGTSTPNATLHVVNTFASSTITLVVQATTSQSSNLTEWRDVAGNVKASVASTGLVTLFALAGNGSLPTISTSTGAGTGAGITATLDAGATNLSGLVTLNTGTSPATNATAFTVTWASAGYTTPPHCILGGGGVGNNGGTGGSEAMIASTTTTTLIGRTGAIALTGATQYFYTYICTK